MQGRENLLEQVVEDVTHAPSPEEMLHNVWQRLYDLYQPISMGLVSTAGHAYRVLMSRGVSNEYVKELVATRQHALIEEILKEGKPRVINEGDSQANQPGYKFENDYKKLIVIPMKLGRQCSGVAFMDFDNADFPEEDIAAIQNIVNLCGLRIWANRLNDQLSRLSDFDPLTQIGSYKYFHESLYRELRRAEFEKYTLVLGLMSIDNLKAHNEVHGHMNTDSLIRQISSTLVAGLRDIDIKCRYGGAKFVVIMPDCTLDDARQRFETIRRKVESLSKDEPRLTVSVGVVSFPDQKEDDRGLISEAEHLVYEARRNKGNQVLASKG